MGFSLSSFVNPVGSFSNLTDTLGLSGSEAAGGNASRQLFQIGENLKNFTPIRFKTAVGAGTYSPSGLDLNLDPRLNAAASTGLDFFGNTMNQLNSFNEGDATAKTLALLRAQMAPQFNSQLGSLESRLLQQGRLGLATGARADNPEMASFFGAAQNADLAAQLAAMQEARSQRDSLLNAANSGLSLAMQSAMPSDFMNGLFNTASMRSARDLAAAQIALGGPALEYKGAEADRAARANFFGNLIGGGIKAMAA